MRVEVFIPTFNRSEKLQRAIQSVLSQTHADVEVRVLDNHSTDATESMVEALMQSTPRIKYFRHERNIGMVPNFNQVQKLVSADFFSVLTDDDEYEPCFVETAIECFKKNASTQFVACNAPTRIGDTVIKSQLDHWREGFYPANTQNVRCIMGHYPLITNCLFRSGVAEDFFFHHELDNVGDGLLLLCLFAKYDAYITKAITGYWNNDGANASSLQKFDAVRHVNISVNELRFYGQFCERNRIAKRGLFLLQLKLLLIVLFAADRAGFRLVDEKSLLREVCGGATIQLLRLLSATRIIRLVTLSLAGLRRINVAWVSWREHRGSARR